jgi:hypothetical protein
MKKILQNLMSINCDEIKEIFPSIHESKLIAPKNENTPYPQEYKLGRQN